MEDLKRTPLLDTIGNHFGLEAKKDLQAAFTRTYIAVRWAISLREITKNDEARFSMNPPDRRALDAVIFDVLGLTQGERDGVYEAVVNLVEARHAEGEECKAGILEN